MDELLELDAGDELLDEDELDSDELLDEDELDTDELTDDATDEDEVLFFAITLKVPVCCALKPSAFLTRTVTVIALLVAPFSNEGVIKFGLDVFLF